MLLNFRDYETNIYILHIISTYKNFSLHTFAIEIIIVIERIIIIYSKL